MSLEHTSVTALSPTGNLFPHNLFPREFNTSSYKSMQMMDTRAQTYLISLSNIPPSSLSENQQDIRRVQRQRQILTGSHILNVPHSQHSSVDVNRDRLGDRHSSRGSHELERNGSLDLLVDSAVNLGDSDYLNTGITANSSPPTSEVDIKLEQKRLEHERQRKEQRKLFEAQMKILELQQLREEQDLLEKHHSNCASSNSAPNTPPSLASNDTRARSNTIPRLNSPKVNDSQNPTRFDPVHSASFGQNVHQSSQVSSRSVPSSRRNSNEIPEKPVLPEMENLCLNTKNENPDNMEKDFMRTTNLISNVNSHLMTGSNAVNASNNDTSFPPFNGNFLLDDDGESPTTGLNANPSSLYINHYLQMHSDDDKFPILVRRDSYPGMLSASSAALDLAPLPQTPSRHRGLDSIRNADWTHDDLSEDHRESRGHMAPLFPESQVSCNKKPVVTSASGVVTPGVSEPNGLMYVNDRKNLDNLIGDNPSCVKSRAPKLSTSYSTPDLASATRLFGHRSSVIGCQTVGEVLVELDNPMTQANQMQNTNDSGSGICRFFQQGLCTRGERCQYAHTHAYGGMSNASTFYGQYNMTGRGGINMLPGVSGFGYSQNLANNVSTINSNNNIRSLMQNNNLVLSKMNQKRLSADLEVNRFSGVLLEDLVGEIYSLCKDQHGCRYLQKKLEEKNDQYLSIIFNEVFSHFVELMTDPFGNYLCQKLLEYCNDDQRTIIIETVAPELVNISLNMHGTRAVQKMIEFLSTPKQVRTVIVALNHNVVTLIKDLNGNHVIQKCLHRLSSEDNQFVYNAVSKNCVEVATHRHGCCVLQRCIDHASESQKIQLVTEITFNALTLVQDPFGNYVVQYVLDLGDSRFKDALIRKFIGNVCLLSVQKFSSNVMEKCIRVSEPETRKLLIDEMLNMNRLDKLLRDSYANYVVQTSLDYADPVQRAQLVDCIRPLLPAIRNTPYGKRIQGKLHREQMQALNTINSLNMNNMNILRLPFNSLGNFNMVGLNDFTRGYPYL
ncbi:6137_t:CDS:10 [Acaulospora morrowiae]|uniref:6137_t:CDS:1 n=2 Tax=Acaulospora morrowiae TaxID=94023 RepID=A0A9N9FPR7_9GLOM|nr:6137_t:CDS:10 [Acaulospora morrowiae]